MHKLWLNNGGEKMTNYEKLKEKSLEEMAEFLDGVQTDGMLLQGSTPEEWQEWLKAEAEK